MMGDVCMYTVRNEKNEPEICGEPLLGETEPTDSGDFLTYQYTCKANHTSIAYRRKVEGV